MNRITRPNKEKVNWTLKTQVCTQDAQDKGSWMRIVAKDQQEAWAGEEMHKYDQRIHRREKREGKETRYVECLQSLPMYIVSYSAMPGA